VEAGSPPDCATNQRVHRSRIATISGCTAFIFAIEA
jgi:hypothetical protein